MKNLIIQCALTAGMVLASLTGWTEDPPPPELTVTGAPSTTHTPLQQCEALVASNDQTPLAKLARKVGCAKLLGPAATTNTNTQPADE